MDPNDLFTAVRRKFLNTLKMVGVKVKAVAVQFSVAETGLLCSLPILWCCETGHWHLANQSSLLCKSTHACCSILWRQVRKVVTLRNVVTPCFIILDDAPVIVGRGSSENEAQIVASHLVQEELKVGLGGERLE